MRRMLIATAALVAAVVVFLLSTLPPRPRAARGAADAGLVRRTLRGAFHVHTIRSDGRGTRESIAAAAARAGLQFVIFADHGNGTAPSAAPERIHGVLCIDGVEISTNGGHYVALDLPQASYPLGGEPAAVVEDVSRLGGFGIVAHADSARASLAWTDWSLAIDGLEWLSLDSEWRNETGWRLFRTILDYPVRPGPALASLLDRPAALLARWDALASGRPLVVVAGADAHGGIGGRAEDGGSRWRWAPAVPSYEAVFGTLSLHVLLDEPPTGNPGADARGVLNAIRAGRLYTAIDAIARPARVDFHASAGGREFAMGQRMRQGLPVTFTVRGALPERGSFVLLRNGREVARAAGPIDFTAEEPGTYRLEGRVDEAPGNPPVPWVVTNPIYVMPPEAEPPEAVEPIAETVATPGGNGWTVEKDPGSDATISRSGSAMTLRYRLRSGDRVSQYVAAATPLAPPLPAFDAIAFTGRARQPMRVSVQVRLPNGSRSIRSVYLASDARRIVVPVSGLAPASGSAAPPDLTSATTLLFVVDLTNAAPGSAGEFTISDPMFVKR